MKLLALALALALTGAALAQPPPPAAPSAPAAPTPAPLPSVKLPPELDRVLRDYEKAWMAKDLATLVKLFTPDGMALPNGRPAAQGEAEITAAYNGSMGTPLALRAIAFGTSGDLGYIIGGFAVAADKPDLGKFTLVLRKGKDGRWLIVSDMDNPNGRRPAPPQGTPPPSGDRPT